MRFNLLNNIKDNPGRKSSSFGSSEDYFADRKEKYSSLNWIKIRMKTITSGELWGPRNEEVLKWYAVKKSLSQDLSEEKRKEVWEANKRNRIVWKYSTKYKRFVRRSRVYFGARKNDYDSKIIGRPDDLNPKKIIDLFAAAPDYLGEEVDWDSR